jgi:hypothetical protein
MKLAAVSPWRSRQCRISSNVRLGLNEEGRDAPCRRSPLERYVRRWLGWAYGGPGYGYESKREFTVATWVALQRLCATADACAPTRLRLPDIA